MTRRLAILAAVALLAPPARLIAADSPATIVQKVGFDQKLGAQMPLDVPLRDESGRLVHLSDYLDGSKPAILTFNYYRCPMLCSKELDSLTRSLRAMTIELGRDFQVITISISPQEPPSLAAAKKRSYLKALDRPGGEAGWHFLTADSRSIAALTDTAGFRYAYNPALDSYAHDAGILIVTPKGRISKYLSGLDYPARSIQAILKASSTGTIGRAITWVKLLCYDYDPSTGKYTLAIMRTVQAGGIATVLALAIAIPLMNRRARLRAESASAPTAPIPTPA